MDLRLRLLLGVAAFDTHPTEHHPFLRVQILGVSSNPGRFNIEKLLMAGQLRHAPGKRERRHFFKRMRRAMLDQGMAMSQRYGLCFLVPVEHTASATDRHVAVDWLVDQPQTQVVLINGIRPIFNYFSKPLDIAFEDDEPVTPEYRAGAERLVRWLVTWALIERFHARKAMTELDTTTASDTDTDIPVPNPDSIQSQNLSNQLNAKEG